MAESEAGLEAMARFLGAENVDGSRAYLEQLDRELHRYIMEFVYGQVYAGDVLDPKTRALCTVAMRACLGQPLQLGIELLEVRAAAIHVSGPEKARHCREPDLGLIHPTLHGLRDRSAG